jgi:hypothetical protein
VNFVGHIATGVRVGDGPAGGDVAFLVGTALPDFASMGRVRLGTASGTLGDGIALHHATDHAFHAEEWFVEIERDLRAALADDGLPDGAARACAHVGPELLLDGAFADDATTADGVTAVWERIAAPDDDVVTLVPASAQPFWRTHLSNVATRLDPFTYGDADVVARRLHGITSRRPRLAFPEELVGAVADRMRDMQPQVEASAPDILDRVSVAVSRRRGRFRR